MDRFGPTGKVSQKRVHLLRWSSFPGRTGWNFGWMDRALSVLRSLLKTQKNSGSRLALKKNFDLHLWASLNFVIWPILQHLLIFITLRGKGLHSTWSLSNKCPVPSSSLFYIVGIQGECEDLHIIDKDDLEEWWDNRYFINNHTNTSMLSV